MSFDMARPTRAMSHTRNYIGCCLLQMHHACNEAFLIEF